nr:Chain B, N-acylethanolamine-hydrolyzing acid amidase beta-subunit [Caenorhabditis elegans]6DY3_D Chain D, N-acylethanolamine-hydrolyzing acid amidase beta-subunit [Caenorhabditis elegans]6DY3_F Chain F, N-acylethanolamine-hydrolyzing acid amidase beta-subunit [Caenorhabditis elegans]6DY3_H Chain H, N-acylethanolamine-hydrolyzing acid amidase beta-subunit [Caenorhabditis elegans]
CTSIVAQNSAGQIIHGRNLDYDMTELLKNITIHVDFVRNGTIQYSGLTFALYNGVLTGQRPGEYSVSLNARYSGAYIDNILMEFYTKFKRPVSFFIRDVLENQATYTEAVDAFSRTHLFSPSYIIVAGIKKNEGVVISRNRWSAANVYPLNVDANQWFLVETNFDNWKKQGDDRRITAIQKLKELGRRNFDEKSMVEVLSTVPVRNNLTVFSTVMVPGLPDSADYFRQSTWILP